MARQLLTAVNTTRAGVTLADATVLAADGAKVAFTTEPRLIVRLTGNEDDAATVTFEIKTLVDGIAVVNGGKQVALAAEAVKFAAPFTNDYKQSDSFLYIDSTKDIGIAVLAVGNT